MQFAIGDKVVHPHHGPGRITGLEHKEFVHGEDNYYVIEIPAQGLTLHIPQDRMEEVGVRPAMAKGQLEHVLDILRSRPKRLPEDHKERQEQVWEKLQTSQPVEIAEAVRDLAWHEVYAHLTKKDTDYLDRGQKLLAAEMALVSGTEVTEASRMIETTLAAAMADAPS
ncbi:MAG TPA: CarD family transcriptional regulator [Anaerolineae bacterium]|nr:CarD family transcriptional regulator [Anaerolineae bacterium]